MIGCDEYSQHRDKFLQPIKDRLRDRIWIGFMSEIYFIPTVINVVYHRKAIFVGILQYIKDTKRLFISYLGRQTHIESVWIFLKN